MAVDGARTALAVYDGVVEFSNPYGSVTVTAGEAAVASIGSAPTKIVVVTPNDREQMLYYLDLRSAFWLLPPSPLERRAMRAEQARLAAVPPAQRTAEEWLTIAEVAVTFDGAAAAQAAVDAARRLRLTRAERARADLVEAMIAGLARRYTEAVRLSEAAEPGLDGHRRAMAVYGRFFAAALADPATASRRPPPGLARSDASAALAEAWIAGFVDGPAAAIDASSGPPRSASRTTCSCPPRAPASPCCSTAATRSPRPRRAPRRSTRTIRRRSTRAPTWPRS